jgi:hypothetical protein
MRSQSLLVEDLGNSAVSGLAKALAGEVASLLKLELARLSTADVQPVLLDVKQARQSTWAVRSSLFNISSSKRICPS